MRIRMTSSIVAFGLLFGSPLDAVELSTSGEGDALIFPTWSTTNGHLSVLSVVDSQWRRSYWEYPTQAVKLLMRDAQGQLLFRANVYPHNSEDSWTASIVSLPDGRSRLASNDESCVLVGEPGEVAPWSGSVELDADHGFIEMIVMATLASTAGEVDCTGLAERWNSGIWSENPLASADESNDGAALRGTLNLVNVQKGTAYTIPATALREFSSIPQHTSPSSALPDLASAHDSGTPEGATRSRVCDANHCEEDTWASPRDAVAAALMAWGLRGEFANSPSLGGRSDMVFTYPLRHHFGEDDHPRLSAAQPRLGTYDRGGQGAGGTEQICPGPNPYACDPVWVLQHPQSLAVFSLPGSQGEHPERPSDVLGIPVQSVTALSPAPSEGTLRVFYSGTLVSNSGRSVGGMPVIGVVLQQFQNGNLTGEDGVQQRANYGVAVPMTRVVP